jgi:hypothetical protein
MMKNPTLGTVILTICLGLLPAVATAQIIQDPQVIQQRLAGQHLEITHSGGIYGWSYFYSVHFCASGNFIADVQSSRTTVLGNHEEHNERVVGRWQVVSYGGSSYLVYSPQNGQQNAVGLVLLANGQFWMGDGWNIAPQGRAQCE